jgi:hypothetical protein
MLHLLLATALADDFHQVEMTLSLSVVHAPGDAHWGVRVGTDMQIAWGDSCEYRESGSECRPETGPIGSLWPIAAPGLGVTWRPGSGWGGDVTLSAGVGSLGMYDYGFLPYAELLASWGHRWGHHEDAATTLGGFVTKTFSPLFFTPEGTYSLRGTDALGARFDLHFARKEGGWTPSVWRLGIQAGTLAGELL